MTDAHELAAAIGYTETAELFEVEGELAISGLRLGQELLFDGLLGWYKAVVEANDGRGAVKMALYSWDPDRNSWARIGSDTDHYPVGSGRLDTNPNGGLPVPYFTSDVIRSGGFVQFTDVTIHTAVPGAFVIGGVGRLYSTEPLPDESTVR